MAVRSTAHDAARGVATLGIHVEGLADVVRRRRIARRVTRAVLQPVVPVADGAALVLGTAVLGDGGSAAVVYTALTMLCLALTGTHRFRISPRVSQSVGWLAACATFPVLVLPLVLGTDDVAALVRSIPLAFGLLMVGRAIAYWVQRRARTSGVLDEPTLIVGAGEVAVTIAHTLYAHPEYGLRPVGIVDDVDEPLVPSVLGGVSGLERVLVEQDVKRVIVAFGRHREEQLIPLLRACTRRHIDVYVTPRFFELGVAHAGPDSEDIWGIPLVRLKGAAFRRRAAIFKRTFDIVVSSVALIILAPVFLLAAVAVKLSGPGPLLYRQQRVGRDGSPLQVLKFRTLPPNSDGDVAWNVKHDGRIGPVGRFLRRTSIDEIPQLFNVLRGHMSIVGPRPERQHFFERFSDEISGYGDRQRVPVGITGWAQVHGLRGDTSISERARFDNYYIEHWSPWLDLVICARTFQTFFHDHD